MTWRFTTCFAVRVGEGGNNQLPGFPFSLLCRNWAAGSGKEQVGVQDSRTFSPEADRQSNKPEFTNSTLLELDLFLFGEPLLFFMRERVPHPTAFLLSTLCAANPTCKAPEEFTQVQSFGATLCYAVAIAGDIPSCRTPWQRLTSRHGLPKFPKP